MHPTKFLPRLLILLALCALIGSVPGANAADTKRPNIVFIFSDDHAYQAISAYGSKVNKTPNIDRLGKEGIRFDRCLVPNSLCGPSRATVLTGKYSHLNGFYNNTNSRFDGTQVTFSKLLQKAGYQTAMIGKWHLVSDPTGFDYWEILPGQGQYYNPPMIRNGERIKHEGYVTDIITDRTLDWLKKRDPTKPFLVMCHHKAPHREWEPNLKNLPLFDGVKFPEPETLFDDYAGRGQAEKTQDMTIAKTMNPKDLKLTPPATLTPQQRKVWDAYYEPLNEAFRKANPQGKALVRWKYQRYMHDYLACIASIDESVGRVLDYLKAEGLDRDTIVVYASDQGFYVGEHGWFDKRWIFEESLRTPLLVRWPSVAKPGSVCKDMVSNLDFAETFLEAAGLDVPAEMQGRSLVPILKGDAPRDWRKSFYYHYYEYPGPHNVRRHYGVVTARYKLVHFYEPDVNYWELFDLEKDPHELRSVYGQKEYAELQKELEKELTRLRTELKVPEKDPPESLIKPRSKNPKSEIRNPKQTQNPKSEISNPKSGSDFGFRISDLPDGRPPNIVFFLIDDMGWTDLGCFGSDLYETPHIDTLAAQGMRFTNAYAACTVCSPTRAALMTGKYPGRLHITDFIHGHKRPYAKLAIPKWTEYLPREEFTIASALKPGGYVSASIGKWHLGDEKEGYPDKHGFDLNVAGCEKGQPPSYFSPYKIPTLKEGPAGEYLTDRLADEAVRFIEANKSKPFFLYFPLYAVHTPLQAKKELTEKYQKKIKPGMKHGNATYAAMIASVDDAVGRVLARLAELGLEERTLVVFTSDNGGLIGSTTNIPLRAGKGSSYEGGVRVPAIVKWRGVTAPGSVCHESIITPDFYATLLQVAGAKGDAKHNANVDGESLVPLLKNPRTRLKRDAIYWHYPHYHPGGATPYGAVRAGDWKLIEFFEDMHVELYNLKDDIGEKDDLAKKMPEKTKELRDKLHTWRQAVGAQMPTANPAYKP
jgi:arylsulfatase A-like enzyme